MTTHEEKFRNIFIVEHDNESEINEEELQSTSIRRVENIEEKEEPRERIEVLTTESKGEETQESALRNNKKQPHRRIKTLSTENGKDSQHWSEIIVPYLIHFSVIIFFLLFHAICYLLQATFLVSALYNICATIASFLLHTACHASETFLSLFVETVCHVCEVIPRIVFHNVFRLSEVIVPLLVHSVCRIALIIVLHAIYTLCNTVKKLLNFIDSCLCDLCSTIIHALTRRFVWLTSNKKCPCQRNREDASIETICSQVNHLINTVFSILTVIVAILDKTLRDICQESVNLIDEIMCKVWIEVMLLLNEIVSNVWNVTVQLVQKIAKEVITTFFTIINSLLRLIETDVKRYCSDVAADLGKAYKNMINSAKRSQLVHKVAKKVITTFFNIITSLIRLIEPHVKRYCSNLTAGLKGVYQDMINSARSQPRKS
ncbi:uncharacterized protein LOC123508694 [Portunus trituberculatus]|uniref:uncharacterized protein LOC123508694 n=1 Tax=Portunus trituberculatus TaxID=210409 RepID=UPI001E1CCE62|nr:uncharacterized protein LOC123508694 [Portunus trituberculatus]